MFDAIKRLLFGRKPEPRSKRHIIETCPDCGVQSGELHDLFCTKETCPFCGGQLITCDCKRSILKLSEDERRTLDEYIDDSIPPVSDIMQRWREALASKGRVPFEAFPDDPIRAAYRGDVDALRLFLEDGFLPNAGNEVGYTALMGAARGASLEAIRFLLSQGAQAALADKRGYTALHWAVAQPAHESTREVACVCVLLDAGADPSARNEDGITPLMNAVWFGCRDSARELLRRGADPLMRDNKGRSARDLASERGHKEVEDLLK
ncbi:MAG: ankyrin repeat domain-containing protein [Chthoniobacteraceae bacterium]